jgi:hypothetical protein
MFCLKVTVLFTDATAAVIAHLTPQLHVQLAILAAYCKVRQEAEASRGAAEESRDSGAEARTASTPGKRRQACMCLLSSPCG